MTYLQILRLLERYAWAQPDVHSVVREFTDLNREEAQYAAVVIQDRDGERDLISDQDWITYTWHIGYVDRLWEEKNENNYGSRQVDGFGSYSFYSNRDDIYSQGIRVINNIIAGLRKDYDLEITTPDRINTFNQRFTAECAGVYMVIAVTVPVSDCETGGVEDMYDSLNQRFTANGTYHFVPDGKPWNEADIEIDVHPQESLVTNFTENGIYDLEGEWKDATIGVNVPGEKPETVLSDSIYVLPHSQREFDFEPPEGYVYSSAHIDVVCNDGPLDETITSNGSYSFEPSGGSSGIDMYNQVNLSVDVHPSTSLSAYYTENGIYTIADEFNGGRIEVDVFVPPAEQGYVYVSKNGTQDFYPEHPGDEVFSYVTVETNVHPSASLSETYTENGTYNISGEFNGGQVTVAVSSQKPEESLVETITSNGSYNYTPQAGYVFDSVALNVDVHPSSSLSRTYTTNGQKTITGEFNGGTININVHPSTSLSVSYTRNGTYNISNEFNGGKIIVNVTSLDPVPADNEIYYRNYTAGSTLTLNDTTDFGANLVSNTVYDNKGWCLLTFDGPVLRSGRNSFSNVLGLQEIILPDTVQEISYNSFGNSGLQRIVMPETITQLGGQAFHHCFALVTHINLPDACEYIGDNDFLSVGATFRGCTALTMITIPASCVQISPGAFADCENLIGVKVMATNPPVLLESSINTYNQFDNNSNNRKIYVPAASLSAYQSAPGWSYYAADIVAM